MGMPSGLGLHPGLASKGLNASMGMPLLWGLASGPASPFFKPYQKVQYKIPQGHICKNDICIKTSFLLVKNISHQIVLRTHFLTQLYPFSIDNQGLKTKYNNQEILFEFIKGIEIKEINQVQDFINLLQQKQHVKILRKEIQYKKTEENLKSKQIQEIIKQIQQQIENNLCSSIPNAFWDRKQHMVSLPYEKDFNEKQIPTKARPITILISYISPIM